MQYLAIANTSTRTRAHQLIIAFATIVVALSIFPMHVHADNTGLVGYWSFNDGTSTKATDFSGNGNTGTLQTFANPPTATSGWKSGKLGNALNFDGSTDFVDTGAGDNSALDVPAAITVSAWIKPTSATCAGFCDIVGNYNAAGDTAQYELSIINSRIIFAWDGGAGSVKFDATPVISSNEWLHVVAVRSSAGCTVQIYFNGAAVQTNQQYCNGGGAPPTSGFGNTVIGTCCENGAFNQDFPGIIDEVRIYNRALGAAEVAKLYQSGAVLKKPANNLGLVGYWSFDEGTGTIATDFSGNGNTGTLGGAAAWATGKRGKAINLTTENSHVATTDIDSTDGASALTVSLWISNDNPSIAWDIISKSTSGAPGWEFRMGASNAMVFTVAGTDDHAPAQAHVPKVWEYWTIVFDGTQTGNDNRLKMYRDGVHLGNLSHFAAVPATTGSNSNAIYIGEKPDLSGTSWRGRIDDVRIYNRALGASEVAKLYGSGAMKFTTSSVELQKGSTLANGLVGHWTFDGPDVTTTVTDRSGLGNHGYFYGGATSSAKVIGKLGQALDFNGSSATVRAAHADVTAFTVSAWIKPDSVDLGAADSAVIVKGATNLHHNYFLYFNNGLMSLGFYAGGPYPEVVEPSATMTAGNWYHVVGTYDTAAGGTLTLYVDGAQRNQSTGNGTPAPDGTQVVSIGAFALDPGQFFSGAIDDVRVYNRTLTAAEAKQLYRLGQVTARQ